MLYKGQEMNDNLQSYEAENPDPQLCSWKDKPSWHHFHSMMLIFTSLIKH
jgi:hypothetical protein